MLPFRLRQFRIESLHFLLLPKMTNAQMRAISGRLAGAGYSTEITSSLTAKSGRDTIHVDPWGVCRSSADVADLVLPAIPGILASEKERIPIGELKSLYFTPEMSGRTSRMRISTRVESSAFWDSMRASDTCGLSPDEQLVALFLLRHSRGNCGMLTDFPNEGSVTRILGRRRYFDSKIDPATAMKTLRVAGTKSPENSYVRRDEMLEFAGFERPSETEWLGLFDQLGEWCFFAPE